MTITFIPNNQGIPPGKLADVELHFQDGLLAGFKLIGLSIWKQGDHLNVMFPAIKYNLNGKDIQFPLLRPIDKNASLKTLRNMILTEYAKYQVTIE